MLAGYCVVVFRATFIKRVQYHIGKQQQYCFCLSSPNSPHLFEFKRLGSEPAKQKGRQSLSCLLTKFLNQTCTALPALVETHTVGDWPWSLVVFDKAGPLALGPSAETL